MAQSGKQQTFSDVIEGSVLRSVLLPPEMLRHVEEIIEANKQLGHITREESILRQQSKRFADFQTNTGM